MPEISNVIEGANHDELTGVNSSHNVRNSVISNSDNIKRADRDGVKAVKEKMKAP